MKLKKRDCDIKMRVVPYGGGWTDVHLDICGDSHYFIISYAFSNQFNDLLALLYKLHPDNFRDESEDFSELCVCQGSACKGSFTWDEEGAYSEWSLERIPDENTDFMLKMHIEHHDKTFEYSVLYKDFCYAVAKACTEMLKEYGFGGYHYSTYTQDMNIRHLLFIKSVALGSFDALELTCYKEKGHGETTDFKKELKLLTFDM